MKNLWLVLAKIIVAGLWLSPGLPTHSQNYPVNGGNYAQQWRLPPSQLNVNGVKGNPFAAPSFGYRSASKAGNLANAITSEPRPIKSSKPVPGTPLHFKEIVIGRCWDYQIRIGLKEKEQINCEKVWDYFHQAFAYKGPCDVTTNDYSQFLEKIEEDIPKNKALLWSGCRELAHKFSDFEYSKRFTILENTLAGYLFEGLTWCGKKEAPGIEYGNCPLECSIQASYWAMANLKFAKKLEGTVHILLNGTRQHLDDGKIYPSYLKDRYYFGPYVIPNIDSRRVKEIRIIVAHSLQRRPLERCGEKTIRKLQNELVAKGIKVICYDDPNSIRHILCAGNEEAHGCSFKN